MTAAKQTVTTVGASVEVQVTDFATPGMPKVWVPATVIDAEPNGKLTDVGYRRHDQVDRNGQGLVQRVLVGPRGGGKTIRLVS